MKNHPNHIKLLEINLKKTQNFLKLQLAPRYIFMKSTNERFDLLEDTQNSPFFLAQCCAKPEKVTQASAGQE